MGRRDHQWSNDAWDCVREWLSTFPFPPVHIYSIPIPSHPHSHFLTYSHSNGIPVWAIPIPSHSHSHGRRHGGSRVGKRPPWKKSGWAWPTLEILAVVEPITCNTNMVTTTLALWPQQIITLFTGS